uniref:Uncharacterized protein n=1 Tax=Cannabis sativa TaxID=3483 RepID=A0A803PT38_CANSA
MDDMNPPIAHAKAGVVGETSEARIKSGNVGLDENTPEEPVPRENNTTKKTNPKGPRTSDPTSDKGKCAMGELTNRTSLTAPQNKTNTANQPLQKKKVANSPEKSCSIDLRDEVHPISEDSMSTMTSENAFTNKDPAKGEKARPRGNELKSHINDIVRGHKFHDDNTKHLEGQIVELTKFTECLAQ